MPRTTATGLTRREALELLGMSAAAAALPGIAAAQTGVTFLKGAIIRTVLKDYAPEDLAGGATLFHEHMSVAPDFLPRWMKFAAETRAANAPRGGAVLHAGRRAHDRGIEHRQARRHRLHRCRRPPGYGTRRRLPAGDFARSELPIVLGGGYYTQPFYPKEVSTMSEEQLVQALIRQVDADPIGVFGEIGSWDAMTADERKVFRAMPFRPGATMRGVKVC